MSNTMKKIITIFSVVIALVITICTIPQTRVYKETIEKGHTTVEEYIELREKATNYAETLQFEENDEKDIEIESKIRNNSVIVKLVKDYRCCMVATYPIIKMEDDSWKIDYENGIYESLDIIYFSYILLFLRAINLYILSQIFLELSLEYLVTKFKEIKEKVIKLKNKLKDK